MKQIIGHHVIETIGSIFNLGMYTQIFVVTDENVAKLYLPSLRSSIPKHSTVFVLRAGEKEKNLNSVEKIVTAMHNAHCDRHSLVINLGGGVVSDIGGFSASIFMRGVDLLNIPTTLLSMIDAAIGGKNGVNFSGVKNLIGTIRQPVGVLIDTACLATLPKREFFSGFAEIIKHGLIQDRIFFDKVTSKSPSEFTQQEMISIIARSCEIKTDIVTRDEMESGDRKLLNFGHTVGHAIEALSLETKKSMLHGQAVAMGMIVESKISQLLGLLSENDYEIIKKKIFPFIGDMKNFDIELLTGKIQSDKKKYGDMVQWTLLDRIGHAVINQKVDEDSIKKAYEDTCH